MKSIIASIALVLLAAPGLAQSPLIASPQDNQAERQAAREAQRTRTQKEWDEYRINPARAGHNALAALASTRSLRPTKDNTADVLRLLETKGSRDDRQMYARLAGDLHHDLVEEKGDESLKRDIREALVRVIKNDQDQLVRKTAMFSYSRMGYFSDSLALLKGARPVLGDQDYHGELAHLLLWAPADEQVKVIKELEAGEGRHNDFAKEILASSLRDGLSLSRLSPEATSGLLVFLKNSEPKFQPNPEAMGVFSLSAYSDWLYAVANITAKSTGEPPRAVMAKLIKLDGDPRKLIAVFVDSRSATTMRSVLATKDLDQVDVAIAAFATKYSTNPNVQDITRLARRHLAQAR